MEKQLNFVIKLTLKEMALRRVVVNLCNETDVLILIYNFQIETFSIPNQEKVSKLVEEVEIKLLRLVLPESLKRRTKHLIRPVLFDILAWKISHQQIFSTLNFYLDSNILKHLSWTCIGEIDYQKTAENLIRLELLDVAIRYKLASLYCLADYIPDVWRQLPEDLKRDYTRKTLKDVMQEREVLLEHYWAHCAIKGEFDIGRNSVLFPTFYFRAFETAACQGNRVATKYFFRKLTNENRERLDSFLFRTALHVIAELYRNQRKKYFHFPEKKVSEVLWYVLSLMRTEYRIEVLKAYPSEVLGCFLYWPLQYFFLDIADLTWTCIPQSKYKDLILFIFDIIRKLGYYFPNLIQYFYLRSPSDCRIFFVLQLRFFLSTYTYAEDAETLKIFLQDSDLENGRELVSAEWFLKLLKDLAERDKWRLVKECIRVTSLSKELEESLKQNITESYPVSEDNGALYRRKWNILFDSLNETVASEIKF